MGTTLLLILLVGLTGTGIAIFDIATRSKPQKSRYRFTTTEHQPGQRIVFDVWTNNYSEALQHAYEVKASYEMNLEWYSIVELDVITDDVVSVIYQKVEQSVEQEVEV
jgi:hypothetical protein